MHIKNIIKTASRESFAIPESTFYGIRTPGYVYPICLPSVYDPSQ